MFKNVVFKSALQLRSFIEGLGNEDIRVMTTSEDADFVWFNYKKDIYFSVWFRTKEDGKIANYISIDIGLGSEEHCDIHMNNEDGTITCQLLEKAIKKSLVYARVLTTPIKSL